MASRRQRMLHFVEPYKLLADRQLRLHGARRGFSVSGDDSETYTYVYCIKLPSFHCETTLKINPLQQGRYMLPLLSQLQQIAMINSPSSEVLQEFQDLRSYTMVKVGISTKPARRLCEIMRSFGEFGARDAEFSAIRESDSPDNTVANGKQENKIVFIKKCRDTDIGDAESLIRDLIGIKLEQPFQDRFTANLGDDKQSALDQVGITEWVLIKTYLMKAIQDQYRRDWPSLSFDHYRRRLGILFGSIQTGQEFYRQLCSFKLYQEFRSLAMLTCTHDVKIEFPPNLTFVRRIV